MKKRYLLVNVLILFILLEIISRLFIAHIFHINIFQTGDIVSDGMYQGITKIEHNDADLNILILGASVMHRDYGDVEYLLESMLEDSLHINVCIVNLSVPAHTMRDSYEKYSIMKKRDFDYVIVYHGINDVRMNNCPQDIYREDYSHSKWFKTMDICRAHNESSIITLPMMIHLTYEKFMQKIGKHQLLPINIPAQHWLVEGNEIKNEQSYKHYLSGIIDIAEHNKSKMILSSFAYYIPDDYTDKGFTEKKLDYNEHTNPISIWGLPDNVAKGIESNNHIVWNIASKNGLPFISINSRIPHNKEYFNDICHLTEAGCRVLALELANEIIDLEMSTKEMMITFH